MSFTDPSGLCRNNNAQERLPPLSQLTKNGLVFTGQAFIMDRAIPYIPQRTKHAVLNALWPGLGRLILGDHTLRGDNHGFLSSPADGTVITYRLNNSITILPDGTSIPFHKVGESFQYDETGAIVARKTAVDTQTGMGYIALDSDLNKRYYFVFSSHVAEPFDPIESDFAGAAIRMSGKISLNTATGMLDGEIVVSGYPSFQFFLNGKGFKEIPQGSSGWSIMKYYHYKIHKAICDPSL